MCHRGEQVPRWTISQLFHFDATLGPDLKVVFVSEKCVSPRVNFDEF